MLHDFTAPFFHYLTSNYHFSFTSIYNEHSPSEIQFATSVKGNFMQKTMGSSTYQIKINDENEVEFSLINHPQSFKTVLCKSF